MRSDPTELQNKKTSRFVLSFHGIRLGAFAILPIAAATFPLGVVFGVSAHEKGIPIEYITLMSALVWAGAAQFAALELWIEPIPIVTLLVVVFSINARLLLLGAALYPWMRNLNVIDAHVAAAFISDANWAYAIDQHAKGTNDIGILVGSGLLMWCVWLASTYTGAAFVGLHINPEAFALDVMFVSFFCVLLSGMKTTRLMMLPWSVAGISALLSYWYLPAGWHVLIGGLLGGIAGGIIKIGR